MGFNEKLAAAKEKGRPSRTVTVSLDAEVSGRLAELEARVQEEAKKPDDGRLAKSSPLAKLLKDVEAVKAEFSGTLVDLKFTRMLGADWLDLTGTNPPRPDVLTDTFLGYNYQAVTRAGAIQSGVLVEDGVERELTDSEWDDLFALLAGSDHEQIVNAVYALNEGESSRAVELGKALRVGTPDSGTKSN
ncbi:hypothetical protein [Curtobacterium sp. SORGH_AS_0776]|uniref:hypothetical protein n=1 Tax=Curtobacterium sp. SORGH_AS_0776 TaxID=3041798 RepID=UPI00285440DF|nr:hypothetical protein [Curtobacterium sp. SORGH_AS_0776]MDR6172651.1 hypothetical protein [Curtobacterium sp. SORGH_AS_0776]